MGEVELPDGRIIEAKETIETFGFVNGLINDTLNPWNTRRQSIFVAERCKDPKSAEQIHRPMLTYDAFLLSQGGEGLVARAHEDPKANEATIKEYNQLVAEYNRQIKMSELDMEKLTQIINDACALYNNEATNS